MIVPFGPTSPSLDFAEFRVCKLGVKGECQIWASWKTLSNMTFWSFATLGVLTEQSSNISPIIHGYWDSIYIHVNNTELSRTVPVTYIKFTQPVPAGGAIQTKLRFVVGRWLTCDATTLHMNWFPNWWSDITPKRKGKQDETRMCFKTNVHFVCFRNVK